MLKLQQKTCFPNISPGGPKNLKLEYRNMVRIVCPIFNSWSFIRIMVLELTDRQRKELIYRGYGEMAQKVIDGDMSHVKSYA